MKIRVGVVSGVALLILTGITGCVGLLPGNRSDGKRPSECYRHSEATARSSTAEQVIGVACARMRPFAYRDIYASYEEDKPNHLSAAIVVASCVQAGACRYRKRYRYSRRRHSYTETASRYHLAKFLDFDAVAKSVASLSVPGWARRRFMRIVRQSAPTLVDSVEKSWNPRERRVFLEPISRIRKQWVRRRATLLPLQIRWAKLKNDIDEALIDKSMTRTLQTRLLRLRDAVVANCKAQDIAPVPCIAGPIARPISDYLVRVSTALDDGLTAEYEHTLLARTKNRSRLQYAMRAVMHDSLVRERALRDEYARAKKLGASQELLARKFGAIPPIDVKPRLNGAGSRPPRDRYHRRRRGVYTKTEVVHTVRRAGRYSIIGFKAIVNRYQKETGCRETNRVDTITRSGRVIYRTRCTGPVVTRTDVQRKARMRVPYAEARHLRRGDVVELAYVTPKGRRGRRARRARSPIYSARVLRVFKGSKTRSRYRHGPLQQLGRYRLNPKLRVGARP
jgi:hypothetical protein